MKRILILLFLVIGFLGHSQSKQKYLRYGKLTTAEINAIDVSDTSVIYEAYNIDNSRKEINVGAGWIALVSGVVAGSVDYADITNKPTIDATLIDGSTNAIQNNAVFDRFVTTVDEAPNSPEETIYWKGTKAQLYAQYGNPATGLDPYVYLVTDSIPATPLGGGDMLTSIYDTDLDNVVDNAEQLGGLPASNYLTTEVDGSVTNELQTLSQSGNDITLSNGGGTVTVAAGGSPQTLSKTGTNITLSDGGGTVSIADNDNSITNEIQTLSKTDKSITLSNGGGTVDIGTTAAFTPTLTTSNGDTFTYSTRSGIATRSGNVVSFWITIGTPTPTGSPTGDIRITGLPYNIFTQSLNASIVLFPNVVSGITSIYPYPNDATTIKFYQMNATIKRIGSVPIDYTDITSLAGGFIITGTYITND